MLLGKLIKRVIRVQGSFVEQIAECDPKLAGAIAAEAERYGVHSRSFVADTISRFLGYEDGDSWTTIISNIQRSDDPGFAFIATVMRAPLDHRCDQYA